MNDYPLETWTVTVKVPDAMPDAEFSRLESTLPSDAELAVLVARKLREEGFAGNDLMVSVSCRQGASAEVAV